MVHAVSNPNVPTATAQAQSTGAGSTKHVHATSEVGDDTFHTLCAAYVHTCKSAVELRPGEYVVQYFVRACAVAVIVPYNVGNAMRKTKINNIVRIGKLYAGKPVIRQPQIYI